MPRYAARIRPCTRPRVRHGRAPGRVPGRRTGAGGAARREGRPGRPAAV